MTFIAASESIVRNTARADNCWISSAYFIQKHSQIIQKPGIESGFLNPAKAESGLMRWKSSRSPPEAGKASLQGGLCALGAFKSSRPDQPSLGAMRKAKAAAA